MVKQIDETEEKNENKESEQQEQEQKNENENEIEMESKDKAEKLKQWLQTHIQEAKKKEYNIEQAQNPWDNKSMSQLFEQ